MTKYITRHDLVPALPDGRLVQLTFSTNGRGLHRISFDYLTGHVSPALLRDIDELARLLSYTATFTAEAAVAGTQPLWNSQIERVPIEWMRPLQNITVKACRRPGYFYEIRCRADLISYEMAAELNMVVFPYLNDVLGSIVQYLRETGRMHVGPPIAIGGH